jgi:hypothetical protein
MSLENKFYEIVAEEIRHEKLVDRLYTRAFAEADGDKNKAQARYIKLRVLELSNEHKKLTQQTTADAHATEARRRAYAYNRYEILPLFIFIIILFIIIYLFVRFG